MQRFLALLLLLGSCASSPSSAPLTEAPGLRLGWDLEAYPAGVVGAVRLEQDLSADSAISYRVGWDQSDRRDWGKHDHESGGGPGLGLGYTHWMEPGHQGWFWGGQIDLWQLDIDWRDDSPARRGSTDVFMVQPTALLGYSLAARSSWRLDWTVSLGAEINVDTDGEDVAQGAVLLLGLRLTSL